ncbi:MAG TPA: PAS domain-containing protein [Candidatus Latescibacteria bacterium]|nr:PAS domain-containing protein [Candidatus Latescibacterota bacterium]
MATKSLQEWEEELRKVVPNLGDLLNHYDFGIRVLQHLDDPQKLLQLLLEEYERQLEALGNVPLVPEEGEEVLEEEKKRLKALVMFATYAAEAKYQAELNEQRMKQNEELKRLNARLHKVLDTAPVGILVLTGDGGVENINRTAAELFGCKPEEVHGKPYQAVLSGFSPQEFSELFTSDEEQRREVTVHKENGPVVLLVTLGLLRGEGGEVEGRVVVLTDITLQRQLEQDRVRLEAVTQTVRALNHEINNPLAIISGKVQLLLMKGEELSEDVRRDLESVEQAARRIGNVVNKLTRVTKVVTTQLIKGLPMLDVERCLAQEDAE